MPGRELHGELVAEQFAQALDDRQAHAEALAAVAFGVGNLIELGEDLGQLVLADADAGVPDLEADAAAPAPRRDQHAGARAAVAQAVLDQVAEDPLEQLRVARHDLGARAKAELQPGLLGLAGKAHLQAPEQVADRERLDMRLDRAGVELGDVEDCAE